MNREQTKEGNRASEGSREREKEREVKGKNMNAEQMLAAKSKRMRKTKY